MRDENTSNANPAKSSIASPTLVAMIREIHFAFAALQAKRRYLEQKRGLREGCIMCVGWEDVTSMIFAGMTRSGRLQWMGTSWINLQV
jgi:hypothetical protein